MYIDFERKVDNFKGLEKSIFYPLLERLSVICSTEQEPVRNTEAKMKNAFLRVSAQISKFLDETTIHGFRYFSSGSKVSHPFCHVTFHDKCTGYLSFCVNTMNSIITLSSIRDYPGAPHLAPLLRLRLLSPCLVHG